MSKDYSTRRVFLKAAGLGMAAIATSSCVSMSGRSSGTQTFTFAQICDTQLGMGGYAHDVKTFKAAVSKINTLKPDFVVTWSTPPTVNRSLTSMKSNQG